jgi:hypothetical protein
MRRLFVNRSEPAKKSGQNIPKNRCRTTIAERMMETLVELSFIGDQVACLSHEPGRPQRNAIPASSLGVGLSREAKGLDLKGRFRCRVCGRKGQVVVSIKWRAQSA